MKNLFKLARERKEKPVDGSYTNKLLSDKSLSKSKVLEEINELIESVDKDTNKIHEAADVFYHLIIYLEAHNIKIEDIDAGFILTRFNHFADASEIDCDMYAKLAEIISSSLTNLDLLEKHIIGEETKTLILEILSSLDFKSDVNNIFSQ